LFVATLSVCPALQSVNHMLLNNVIVNYIPVNYILVYYRVQLLCVMIYFFVSAFQVWV